MVVDKDGFKIDGYSLIILDVSYIKIDIITSLYDLMAKASNYQHKRDLKCSKS